MNNWKEHCIPHDSTILQSLARINSIGLASHVLYVTDESNRLLGSLTDGDIRRALLDGVTTDQMVTKAMNASCIRVTEERLTNEFVQQCRKQGIASIPVINDAGSILNILNLDVYREILPVHAVIMAGGKGQRLLPLTKDTPKPLLKVGDQPIMGINIDRLKRFGVRDIHISINYKGDKIIDAFNDGSERGLNITYIKETKPLGTIGSLALADNFRQDTILLMNSDLLTNIDFGDFYREFIETDADMAVATIPHHVDLPYAIVELNDNVVCSLKEKPRYTYFANAGIYLIKKELLVYLPKDEYYNATDLMEKIIADGKKLVQFPIHGYWLDIGRMTDYLKAQEDIKHIAL